MKFYFFPLCFISVFRELSSVDMIRFAPPRTSSETQGQIKGARESLNGRKNIYGTKKSKERRPFGTGLVRHCPQGLFSPFFTFLRAIFFRPFRLSLFHTSCPWVSEDAPRTAGLTNKGYDLSSDLSKGEIGRLSSRIFVSHNMFCLQMGSN